MYGTTQNQEISGESCNIDVGQQFYCSILTFSSAFCSWLSSCLSSAVESYSKLIALHTGYRLIFILAISTYSGFPFSNLAWNNNTRGATASLLI